MSEPTNPDRRRFLGSAAMALAAAPFAMSGPVLAQSGGAKPGAGAIKPGAHTSFAALKQVEAGVLNIGYAEAGPADGPVVILLHGWPYDIHTYVDVAPLLATAGYRVIVPYLRGYGTTRFLSADTLRNGQQARARHRRHRPDGCAEDREGRGRRLRLGRAHGRHRRGALAGARQGAGLGQRLSDRQPGGQQKPLPPKAELQWWYQYYFATERGRRATRNTAANSPS